MDGPKEAADKLTSISKAWQTLAEDKSFGGMTLAEFQAAVKPSFDARDAITDLDNQLTAAKNIRDKADQTSLAKIQLVVNGVVGDPNFGPDSDLYEAMGYVRKSERKSGLTRKGKGKAA